MAAYMVPELTLVILLVSYCFEFTSAFHWTDHVDLDGFLYPERSIFSPELLVAVIAVVQFVLARKTSNEKRHRRIWVNQLLQKRNRAGFFDVTLPYLRQHDHALFKKLFRMTPAQFDWLYGQIFDHPLLQNLGRRRDVITIRQKLYCTLNYLATGNDLNTLYITFLISPAAISKFLPKVTYVIYLRIGRTYLQQPTTTGQWLEIADGFEKRWNLPHCVGAIDGKHIVCEKPNNTGSLTYNYKGTYSYVLLAACDYRYRFTFISPMHYGSECDAGILDKSEFGQSIVDFSEDETINGLNLPLPSLLPKSDIKFPYFFAGDEGFPLLRSLIRPYSRISALKDKNKRIFNYRLSRGRRVIENAFGILASRFRVFRKPMDCSSTRMRNVILCCCALHNWLLTESEADYAAEYNVDQDDSGIIHCGRWRAEEYYERLLLAQQNRPDTLFGLEPQDPTRAKTTPYVLRDILKAYVIDTDPLSWYDTIK